MQLLQAFCVVIWIALCRCDSATDAKLKDAFNCFSLNFYKKLIDGQNSMVSSPFSLDIVLSMIRSGAGGATAQQLDQALGYSGQLTASQMQESVRASLEKMTSSRGSVLDIANSIWIDKNFKVKDGFARIVTTSFNSKVENVDFENKAQEATDQINSWTDTSTHGMISKLFDDPLDRETVMVLANAMFFNGTWQSKFEPESTADGKFFNGGSIADAIDAQLMNQIHSFGYKEDTNAEYLELPYRGGHVSMFVILPKSGTTLEAFENTQTCGTFSSALGSLERKLVDVTIPKFKISSKFDLKSPIQKMGIIDAFEDNADFSGISDQATKVSKAIQKAIIKVNEDGTEAAVVTGLTMVLTSFMEPTEPQVTFRADRPFMYVLQDKRSGLILFIGRVNKQLDNLS